MTRWSWKLGQVAGIDVWVGISHYLEHHRWADAGAGVVFILAVFGIVVVHELGHALTARHYGIRTRDIMLLPIGGVGRLERMPDDPKQELLVALAGPAVNAAIAALLFALVPSTMSPAALGDIQQVGGGFLVKVAWVTLDNIGEFVTIQSALRTNGTQHCRGRSTH